MIKCAWVIGAVLLAAGCHSRPVIPVNRAQALVMESSVLVAGITAGGPDIDSDGVNASASASLYNEGQTPVTLNYRFYWYDVKGLEMHPLDQPQRIVVPARTSVKINTVTQMPGARQVRLYLYL